MKGKIFDIRRFSTHDGEGIRTTVFMKGCPLRCAWCQNPEGIDSDIKPIYMANNCLKCGNCVHLSKNGGARSVNGSIEIQRNVSDDWEEMIAECPAAALRMDARYYSVDELVAELRKDMVFFKHGGGVTFSGGEPLMQADFISLVLKRLKKEGINTTIETSLSVSDRELQKVVGDLDGIYADLKILA